MGKQKTPLRIDREQISVDRLLPAPNSCGSSRNSGGSQAGRIRCVTNENKQKNIIWEMVKIDLAQSGLIIFLLFASEEVDIIYNSKAIYRSSGIPLVLFSDV